MKTLKLCEIQKQSLRGACKNKCSANVIQQLGLSDPVAKNFKENCGAHS